METTEPLMGFGINPANYPHIYKSQKRLLLRHTVSFVLYIISIRFYIVSVTHKYVSANSFIC